MTAVHAEMLLGWQSRQGTAGTALSSGGWAGAGKDTKAITSVPLTPDFCGSHGSNPMVQSVCP